MGGLQEVFVLLLKAGVDMDMVGEGYVIMFKKFLEEGVIMEVQIDLACQCILIVKEWLGLFDDFYCYFDEFCVFKEIFLEKNCCFLCEVVGQLVVLLKNEGGVLFLDKLVNIVLIGLLVDN